MSFDLESAQALLLVGAFWLLVLPRLSKMKDRHRAVVTSFAAIMGLRYLCWRLCVTVIPFTGTPLERFWVYTVFIVEVLAFIEICIFLLIMSRINSRHKEADIYREQQEYFPSVDILIPTYNEGLDVLEKTIVGAMHIDYPDFKVYVLDDGKRPWLKDFCEQHKVGYITREDNAHAKAGNINNGLRHCHGELFAIFDADFVPASNFLRRTTGFFVYKDNIGLVQTPQHFFNRDPIQSNLYLEKSLPDEQRLFFDAMAPCRDRWDAAFCCGSCSIARRSAVDEIGGIPTSSITEDLLTTLCLLKAGYRTIYLNEKLSHGMSSESLKGFFIQRGRWCRGGIQCMFVPEGPLRAKGLSLLQRILFTPYSWLIQPVTRFMLLAIPIVYLYTGVSPLHFTSNRELIAYQFPMFLAFLMVMEWVASHKYVPILSSAVNVFEMFRLLPVVISSLIKPFGEPFRVTPKGSGSTVGIDWYILGVCAFLIFMTATGVVINLIPEYRIIVFTDFFPYALLWCSFNLVILIICALLCFDTPRKRKEERFSINETSELNGVRVNIADMSLGGCKLTHGENRYIAERGERVHINISGVSTTLEAEVKNANLSTVMLEFSGMLPPQREELIAKLFTGRYDNEIHETATSVSILKDIFHRAFGKELH
eukprot:TRINITY_DN10099_c0_g1_i10.p1 TRINITY_DN10099_c0_g1~~TRINITY_DN10099_c0_g1_i10.p1  ORF type:complete len:651 (-),score=73.71 TRINITY_DN10099_c0_g1_i10:1495-3447(-)